ncbi:MAG TPA: retroviral-like aspartic protease family protein [Dehalococcoidia bacterium]|nr:retroviral-like aspartic protease family protein [Dehalococcoidia bacterium]
MGPVRVNVRIANPSRRHDTIEVSEVLVDTGATWTVIPRRLANQLGLETLGRKRVRTANGDIDVDHSFAFIEYEGRQTVSDVMITDSYPDVLLGVFTLEEMALTVDPKSGRLVDSELLLL